MGQSNLQPYPVNATLAILAQDIEFGIAQDSASCAIAHAIYRTFPDAMRVRVNRKTISWSDRSTDVRYVYPTPPRADENIIKPFDTERREDVKPQRITLTGGQFREVRHLDDRSARRAREAAREQKRDDPDLYERNHRPKGYERPQVPQEDKPRPASRIYERYVPTKEDL